MGYIDIVAASDTGLGLLSRHTYADADSGQHLSVKIW